jgi:hypothetical protein
MGWLFYEDCDLSFCRIEKKAGIGCNRLWKYYFRDGMKLFL